MIRSTVGRRMLIVAATLALGGATAINCSNKQQPPSSSDRIGSIGMQITLANGASVTSVSYKISGNGITPVTGGIPVTDPAGKVSVFISGIPAGQGYKVELLAASPDGKTTCAGDATFDVVALSTTSVTVTLQCRGTVGTGSVAITGKFNACPQITALSAAPLAVAIGGTINLTAAAADSDATDTLTYAWAAPAGTFSAATAATTTYSCAAGGEQKLKLTVSDGQCTDVAEIPVSCIALSCGNGAIDQGEECDPPSAANNCDTACKIIPVCGNGKVEKGEQCDPADGVVCSSTCQNIPVVCGNSIKQPGEDCDPPNGTTCSTTCKTVTAAVCGNGTVEAGEDCEPPSTATCSATCKTVTVDNCSVCEQQHIASGDCEDKSGCDKMAAGADKDLCVALANCMKTTKCWTGSPIDCLCGTATGTACASDAANGACKAQVRAATKAAAGDNVTPGTKFFSFSVPAGYATNLVACDVDFCANECK